MESKKPLSLNNSKEGIFSYSVEGESEQLILYTVVNRKNESISFHKVEEINRPKYNNIQEIQ
jgi:hypothetical protein